MQAAPLLVHPRYEVGAELGRGAQGVVVRVVDREAPERALVAKVWREGRLADSAIEGEFSLLRRLDVPGLVRAYDLGRDARTGAAFFVEDFVAGAAASEFVGSSGNGRAERLFQVVAEVATTLAALHDAAFVHGDLKPVHVRVTAEGQVYLLDFGAAVASVGERSAQAPIATHAFAAPEVLAGERASALSDLFSLGALTWALATGSAPGARPGRLRARAPWVPPSMAELIEQLLQPHPRDRPASAEAVLGSLGLTGLACSRRVVPAPVGRERELLQLTTPRVGVRYLVGPSGVGKSHLLREVVTRALLAGRDVRRVAFPSSDALLVSELLTFLRGTSAAWPFTERRTTKPDQAAAPELPTLLVFDELHTAPAELVAALDAYRCRGVHSRALDIIGAVREAPEGSERLQLGPLADAEFSELCARLGVSEPGRVAKLAQVTLNNPGWLVAAQGRVPLTPDMVLERTRGLSAPAVELLATLALLGGVVEEALLDRAVFGGVQGARAEAAELLAAGLATRRAVSGAPVYALQVPELAVEIATALGSFELAERAAALALADDNQTPRALLALASAPFPTSQRERLLQKAAGAAERAGLAGEQADALLALAASPAQRSPALLTRLERLTRSAGTNHPQVLQWLAEAAETDAALLPLSFRRQAEQAARAGDFELAERRAAEAQTRAADLGDRLTEALALATRGAVALFRADVAGAERALLDARARLATFEVADLEELARLDHNLGVVALYTDRIDDAVAAFERSLVIKRKLGDRAGVRSCLLNLGLALARRGDYDDAARTLTEAHALAQALQQRAGRAWCLAARADVELRRKQAAAGERFIAEAEAISEAPPSVRADLALLRGQLALLRGDGPGARKALLGLTAALRASDAMVDARALLIEAESWLASLPAAPRRAARLAIAAIRVARAGRLSEVEALALALLRNVRQGAGTREATRYADDVVDAEPAIWTWLEQVANVVSDTGSTTSVTCLLRTLRGVSRAERVLLVTCHDTGALERAWGVDFEGFELPSALQRCDQPLVAAALAAQSPLYQRDVETPAGRGSRLALALPGAARAVLVLEHRFRPRCFDALDAQQTQRFAVAAALALRLTGTSGAAVPVPAQPAVAAHDSLQSTALPLKEARRHFAGIVGSSRALRAALARLDSAIDSDLPVLIGGETGTGKELFARALHELGARGQAPFVAVNCAAIPDALFEAELFGHARGAFTGAERARAGLIARAEGGTLFLDEIGELPLARQAALLRVLEARRFRMLGSDEERACDVRIVAATNRVLEDEVARGAFRQDLLYRINVIEVRVPALRERPEDIPELVQAFLARAHSQAALSPDVFAALEAQPWPGNVRELEHQIQRLLALGLPRVELSHLPRALRRGAPASLAAAESDEPAPADARSEVQRALRDAGGNITHAARALGLTRHGLKKRMLRLGLRVAAAEGERS
ncbi:MAG TPA: sigma 54-interacting transcriptional regulator [Polyangiaceae bacterium]